MSSAPPLSGLMRALHAEPGTGVLLPRPGRCSVQGRQDVQELGSHETSGGKLSKKVTLNKRGSLSNIQMNLEAMTRQLFGKGTRELKRGISPSERVCLTQGLQMEYARLTKAGDKGGAAGSDEVQALKAQVGLQPSADEQNVVCLQRSQPGK
eukprot:scaffold267965_cov19-Tisochrysis_lutea.AAC.2